MKLMEKIYESISRMDVRELNILYGQIKLMEMMKSEARAKKKAASIAEVHEMTASSPGSWSDELIEDREDRL
ncbi:MAG: hypothetical protein ACLFUL_17555 [Desulfobacteraceae bacterium]